MYFHIIASGSKGNATLIVSNKTKILIDMGISFKRLKEGLAEIGFTPEDIDAALFTHDHTDHISGLKFLSPKICYGLEGTLPSLCNVIEEYKEFAIKEVKILPIKTSHDATNPCGYILHDDTSKLVYVTDTGIFHENNYELCNNPDYLLIESNHDVSMEMNTKRPENLKERILGDKGHLCNEVSAFTSARILGEKTKEIVLMHLSEEANTPELALKVYNEILTMKNISVETIKIRAANQYKSLTGGNYED